MSDLMPLVLALVAGAFLGVLFFGGLWWTIHKGVTSERPALWFVGSLILRTGVVLAGFYFVSQGHWPRLVACLVGFMVARAIVVRRFARAPAAEPIPMKKEAGNAS